MGEFTDNSNAARLNRLEARLAAAGIDLSDAEADTQAKPDNSERIKTLKKKFKAHEAATVKVDDAVDALIAAYAAAEKVRKEILDVGLQGSEKFSREKLRGNNMTLGLILGRLARGGIGTKLIAHDVPRLAPAMADIHTVILRQIEGETLDDLLA